VLFAEPDGSRRRLGLLVGALALLACSLLTLVGRAQAGDQVYWVNNSVISYSQLDDGAGGYLPASFGNVHNGEGAAIDTANGRIYISQKATNKIVWFGLDGLTTGVVNTAAGSVVNPTNISIDPRTQTLYWANDTSPGSIGYAFVNETGGGVLVQSGSTAATVDKPTRIAVDTLHNRVYWWNEGSNKFSWVTMNGLTGGNLSTPGLSLATAGMLGGMVVEPYSVPEELYFINNEAGENGGIFHTDPVLGGEPEEIQGAFGKKGSNTSQPTGLAFDGTDNGFYWANRGVDEEPDMTIGTATIFGHAGTLKTFPVAPIHNPMFATILKAPVFVAAPLVSVSGYTMGCTLGEWEGDHPGASVYVAPTTYSYQWLRSSAAIPGATDSSFTATESGSYTCQVTAANAAGETIGKSRATTLTFPAKPKPTTTATTTTKPKTSKPTDGSGSASLASSKPVKVRAGGTAVVSVKVVNTGTSSLGSTNVCGTLTKRAKKGMRTPACVKVTSVAGGKTAVAKLKVKTLASARGTYKLTVAMSGALTASLTAKVQVTPRRR
jgi:hypothetical protein